MTKIVRWAVLCLVLAGCDLPGKPADPARKIVDFTLLYQKNCAGCHGKDGKLGPAPPLHDAVFLAIVSDADLTHAITSGRKGTSMPSFAKEKGGSLTGEQIQALVKGMRKEWGTAAPAKSDWPAYRVPAEKGDAKRGQAVFARACAACHGDDGTKDLPIHDSAFLALSSEQMLRRIVITGRPDLGMPDCLEPTDGRPLTAAEVNDVVALMVSWKK